MVEPEILKKLSEDMGFLKKKLIQVEMAISEIDKDIHREVNLNYLRKLRIIKKQKGRRFKNMKDFDRYFSM